MATRASSGSPSTPEPPEDMPFQADPGRYERMPYRRSGRSGLQLPAISLGLWHNFGDDRAARDQRAILRRAFDLGVTHFDLANNYGPPSGLRGDQLRPDPRRGLRALPRRAGHLHQGRLRHVARPVRRVGLPQVPAGQPRPEPAAAWASTTSTSSTRTASTRTPRSRRRWARWTRAVRPGQGALRRHLLLLGRADRARRRASCATLGTPLLIHQPSYSMLNRWIEDGLLDALGPRGRRAASPSRRWPRAC